MIKAKLRHLRISPRKVRLVADLIRGMDASKAQRELGFLAKRASRPVLKLLNSALANAQHNANLEKENLYIAAITVDPGPTLKRWRPRAFGRASQILKRTSHITLILKEKTPSVPKKSEPKKEPEKTKEKRKTGTDLLPKAAEPVKEKPAEDETLPKTKESFPARPYPTTSRSKKKFFSRQTFGNAKKIFRRKSI